MVVAYNDIINAIARAEDVALYNARARAIELSNGCKPSKADDDKAIEIESWIQLLTRAAATIDETTCLDDDIIWQIIQNVNELNRDVDCDVSRTYSRHSSSGGGSNVPSGYVERVLGLYVDNTDPSNPIIRIYVNPATISGDGTITSPFSAIGGGGGAVSSVNGLTGAVVLTTTNITEGINLYYTNARGIASILSGLSVSGGAVIATDTILQAVGKLQNQINGLAGGVEYQGTWNASTNTPTLTSSVGTQGHYYVVSVAGSTNLNGITDWALGDWAIFNGTVWQKVDNTDAVISVNGQTGIVALTTTDISEGTNQYFTTARVLATAITGFVAGAGTVAATDTILQAINKIVGNIAAKQDTLVSGTNIKTVNGNSLLGSGDLAITGVASLTQVTGGVGVASTSITYSNGIEVPVGTFVDGSMPLVRAFFDKSHANGNVIIRLYINDTNDITTGSPILFATSTTMGASTRSSVLQRLLTIVKEDGSGGGTKVQQPTFPSASDIAFFTGPVNPLAVDWNAANKWIVASAQNGSTSDTTTVYAIKIDL